jgi:hypothetical protein|tara:strand:+ start:2670 stop:2789 length:120 start_codon:yes stop_codon:yes gene_type:complete
MIHLILPRNIVAPKGSDISGLFNHKYAAAQHEQPTVTVG